MMFDKSGNSYDLIFRRARWLLVDIDDFEVVLTRYFSLTEAGDVADRANGVRGGARHIQTETIALAQIVFHAPFKRRD